MRVIGWVTAAIFAMTAVAGATELRIGAWNISNLHHETGVALRDGAVPRRDIDYDRLRDYAASLYLDIVALQEIGSPAALQRVFPAEHYHLVIADDYMPGAELAAESERDIYNAFAIRKSTFPELPLVWTVDALRIAHVTVNRYGKPEARPVRSGLVLSLTVGDDEIELMNVHLKASCNASSLNPVYDTSTAGNINRTRYDCRTLLAQGAILESWIEQRHQIGKKVIVLGDFNRHLNRTAGTDHFWQMLNDGGPDNLNLVKAPESLNTVCWPQPHGGFFPESIDFIVFDAGLSDRIDAASIEKVGIPYDQHADYAGRNNQRLSDHCPVIGVLAVE